MFEVPQMFAHANMLWECGVTSTVLGHGDFKQQHWDSQKIALKVDFGIQCDCGTTKHPEVNEGQKYRDNGIKSQFVIPVPL